jgi:hypothetical protein
MTMTEGIEAVYLETHNWGKSAKFFQKLGYTVEFETDHNSGQLRNGDGPWIFIADVATPFETTHWGARELTLRDPDGRVWRLQSQAAK